MTWAVASASVLPTTLGTVTSFEPFETLSRTLEPFAADSPRGRLLGDDLPDLDVGEDLDDVGLQAGRGEAVACLGLADADRVRNRHLAGPFETSSCTVEPSSCSRPGAGLCWKTVPCAASFGWLDDVGLEAVVLERVTPRRRAAGPTTAAPRRVGLA